MKKSKLSCKKIVSSYIIVSCLLSGCNSDSSANYMENFDTESENQFLQAENLQDTQEQYEIYTVKAYLHSYNSGCHCGDLQDINGELWHFDNLYLYDTEYIITYGTNFELISLQYDNMIVHFVG